MAATLATEKKCGARGVEFVMSGLLNYKLGLSVANLLSRSSARRAGRFQTVVGCPRRRRIAKQSRPQF
jgi:hypothetical protein